MQACITGIEASVLRDSSVSNPMGIAPTAISLPPVIAHSAQPTESTSGGTPDMLQWPSAVVRKGAVSISEQV